MGRFSPPTDVQLLIFEERHAVRSVPPPLRRTDTPEQVAKERAPAFSGGIQIVPEPVGREPVKVAFG